MQKILAAAMLLTCCVASATAQSRPGVSMQGDVAATYQWVHTNAQPGQCGCFGLSGGALSASWQVRPRLSVVADVSSETSGSAGQGGSSLTLTSYLAGLRYYTAALPVEGLRELQPFGEVLAGAAHAGGSGAGAGDGAHAFAARVGGGLDLPVSNVFVLRLVEIDYLPTTFDNTSNQHQNNLVVGGGVALRWSKPH